MQDIDQVMAATLECCRYLTELCLQSYPLSDSERYKVRPPVPCGKHAGPFTPGTGNDTPALFFKFLSDPEQKGSLDLRIQSLKLAIAGFVLDYDNKYQIADIKNSRHLIIRHAEKILDSSMSFCASPPRPPSGRPQQKPK